MLRNLTNLQETFIWVSANACEWIALARTLLLSWRDVVILYSWQHPKMCGGSTSTWEVALQPRRKSSPFQHQWLSSGFGSSLTVDSHSWTDKVVLGLCSWFIVGQWWKNSIPSIQNPHLSSVVKWSWILKLAFGWSSMKLWLKSAGKRCICLVFNISSSFIYCFFCFVFLHLCCTSCSRQFCQTL